MTIKFGGFTAWFWATTFTEVANNKLVNESMRIKNCRGLIGIHGGKQVDGLRIFLDKKMHLKTGWPTGNVRCF